MHFEEAKKNKTFAIIKAIAKFACKNIIPAGGIIADAIDAFNDLKESEDREKVEQILDIVSKQSEQILKITQQLNIETDEQFATISELPEVKKSLQTISSSIKNIDGIEEFLYKEFAELKSGQETLIQGQEKILKAIQEPKKKTITITTATGISNELIGQKPIVYGKNKLFSKIVKILVIIIIIYILLAMMQ